MDGALRSVQLPCQECREPIPVGSNDALDCYNCAEPRHMACFDQGRLNQALRNGVADVGLATNADILKEHTWLCNKCHVYLCGKVG
ncbi:hypothetical protein HaLaN_24256 [Haematococcus lacustris]|uniref:PHD-type domain-containing protein n=1 Tax=Haematococcus lacustris TaxID=44745 RepID=A0A699ZW25_HAELA|nr:hypothetical protein HaLaN_24256 [Haematococcus lacustris]